MRFGRKKKKKEVTLFLEKDGATKEIKLNLKSTWNMIKKVKTLSSLNRKGWKLIKTEGDPKTVAMFNDVIKGFSPSLKQMKDFADLPKIPEKVKKLFGKEEDKKEMIGCEYVHCPKNKNKKCTDQTWKDCYWKKANLDRVARREILE